MTISFTARTVSRIAIIVVPVLAGLLTLAADSSAAEPTKAPVCEPGTKIVKSVTIREDGAIVSKWICKAAK